jgi:hypothetical protein
MRPPCSVVPVLTRYVPGASVEQQVANSMPAFLASASGLAIAALLAAWRITAFARSRMADSKALLTFSGEPSVLMVVTVQPRVAAPSERILPCWAHAVTPQLM